MEKICSNCDKYPFCDNCEGPQYTCETWIKESYIKED